MLCYITYLTILKTNLTWKLTISAHSYDQSVYTHGWPCNVRLPFDYTHGPKIIEHATLLFLSFSYAPKDLAPFSYISPQKNPLSMIKYALTIELLSANG